MIKNNDINLRTINSKEDLENVYRIVHDAYVKSGYIKPKENGMHIEYEHLDNIPETKIIVAEIDNKIVGTISWTKDNKFGIHTDVDFPEETDWYRKNSKGKIGSSWRIVTMLENKNFIKIVLSLIEHAAVTYLSESEVEDCLYTFNPKHADVYSKILNMKVIAEKSNVEGLENAPVVLMHNTSEDIKVFLEKRKNKKNIK